MKFAFLNPQSKAIQIDGIGPVVLRRNRRTRRLTLRISCGKPVTLTLPLFVSEKTAFDFLEANREWALRKLQALRESRPPVLIIDGTKPVQTRGHRLELQPVESDEIKVSVRSGIINVRYPAKESITNPRVQESIALGLTAAYRIEAKRYLPPRVHELAGRHDFRYNRLFIKDLRSRWGSCSAANNINLNLHLMRLPDKLIDYVILHELVHTHIKNHSPLFWQELERILPDARILRRRLSRLTKTGLLQSIFVAM